MAVGGAATRHGAPLDGLVEPVDGFGGGFYFF